MRFRLVGVTFPPVDQPLLPALMKPILGDVTPTVAQAALTTQMILDKDALEQQVNAGGCQAISLQRSRANCTLAAKIADQLRSEGVIV